MRTEVHVHGTIYLCEGVARVQVEAAMRPWLEYLDVERIEEAKSLEPDQPGLIYHEQDRALEICWTGDVGRSFQNRIEECMEAIGPLAEQATEVELSFYHEDGQDETRLIFVGPTPEAIHEAQRRRMVEDVSGLLARHFDERSVAEVCAVVNDLFRKEWDNRKSDKRSDTSVSFHNLTPPGRKHLH